MPSQSGSLVALGRAWYGQPAFVDVWDISSMKRIGRYKSKDAGTLTSFSFDNSLLAVEGAEKVTIWRIASGKQVTAVKSDGIMEFSPKVMELAATDGANLIIYVPKQWMGLISIKAAPNTRLERTRHKRASLLGCGREAEAQRYAARKPKLTISI